MTFAELLAEDTTETLYPILLPEDENGLVWHLVEMTKEEVIATLEANSCKDDSVSELILEYNQQLINEFEVSVVKYSDASFEMKYANSSSFKYSIWCVVFLFTFLVCILLSGFLSDFW